MACGSQSVPRGHTVGRMKARALSPFHWLMLAAAVVVLVSGLATSEALPVKESCPPTYHLVQGNIHSCAPITQLPDPHPFSTFMAPEPTSDSQQPLRILIAGASVAIALILAGVALKGVSWAEDYGQVKTAQTERQAIEDRAKQAEQEGKLAQQQLAKAEEEKEQSSLEAKRLAEEAKRAAAVRIKQAGS